MRTAKPEQLALRFLLPLLLAAGLHLAPRPARFDAALQAIWQARLSGDVTGEREAIRRAAAFQPWRGDLWVRLAELGMQSQDWPAAVAALQQAQRWGALSGSQQAALGEAYWQQGMQPAAVEAWRPLLQNGAAGQELFERVYTHQRSAGDYEGALSTLSWWRAAQPEDAQVGYRLGMLRLLTRPEDGLELLEAAADADAALRPGVYALRQALKAGEPNPALHLGRALGQLGEWDLAVVFLRRAVQAEPENADAWAFLGEALDQAGQDGSTEIGRALELAPRSVAARAGAALHWRRQHRPDLALAYLETLAREQPQQAVWQIEMGKTLAEEGNLPAAAARYRRALELEPENAGYWNALALFCVQNHYDLQGIGLPAARQALLLSPGNPESLDLMGMLLMQLEDLVGAERFLQQALQKDAMLAPAHLHLGQVYLYQGQNDLARQHLTQAAEFAGKDTETGLLAKRLLQRYYPGSR